MPGKRKGSRKGRAGGRGPRVLRVASHQTGSSDPVRDRRYHALPPGKRVSKTGRVYYEYRRNRSDLTPDEMPPGVKRKLRKGLKSRKKGSIVMDYQQCIARADGMKLVLMPPSDTSHIPFAAVVIGDDKITGTYLQVRDSVLYHYGREKRDLYNRLLRRCWAHPGVKLWELGYPAKAGMYPRPYLILDADGRKIGLRCRDGLLKPFHPDDEGKMANLIAKLGEKERKTLRQALLKYSELLCRGGR